MEQLDEGFTLCYDRDITGFILTKENRGGGGHLIMIRVILYQGKYDTSAECTLRLEQGFSNSDTVAQVTCYQYSPFKIHIEQTKKCKINLQLSTINYGQSFN